MDRADGPRAAGGRRSDRGRGANPAHRPRRRSRRPRSDAGAHLRRPHRVRVAVRQAVRHRRKAQHRAAARHLLRMVGGQQGADHEAADRRHLPRRREVRRGGRQVQHRAPQDDGGLEPPRRAGAGGERRRRRRIDRAPQPVGAVRAAARRAGRPRRHDGLAEGGAGRGRQVRRQAGVLGAVQVRRARRAGPHRRSSAIRTTGTRARSTSTGSSTCRSSMRRCGWPTCSRASSTSSSACRPPTCRRSRPTAASRSRKITEIGYQGITINIGKSDLAQKNPLGRDPRVREAFELVARPRRHRPGRDGRRSRRRQPVGGAEQRVLREERADSEARRRARQGAAEGSGRDQSDASR